MNPICTYCGKESLKVCGKEIYPHRKDLYKKIFYKCNDCNAYVGCHENTDKPLGILADENLRKIKTMAHRVFDPLWKNNIFLNRLDAYKWLSEKMNIPLSECHIGMFNTEQCLKVIKYCSEKLAL